MSIEEDVSDDGMEPLEVGILDELIVGMVNGLGTRRLRYFAKSARKEVSSEWGGSLRVDIHRNLSSLRGNFRDGEFPPIPPRVDVNDYIFALAYLLTLAELRSSMLGNFGGEDYLWN